MIKIINSTPHTVKVVDAEGNVVKEFAPELSVRLSMRTEQCGSLDGIALSKTVYGDVEGLPAQEEGIFYIVSAMVKAALPARADLLVPAEQVRDDQGRVVGCKSLGM